MRRLAQIPLVLLAIAALAACSVLNDRRHAAGLGAGPPRPVRAPVAAAAPPVPRPRPARPRP